jgi:dipeptidyl-peptidase-4
MDTRLSLDDLGRLPLPGTDVPAAIAFTPDGQALTYLHSADGTSVRSLWWYDLATGERRVVAGPPPGSEREETLSVGEQLRRERMRTVELGVTEYAWASDAARPTLLVPRGGQVLVGRGSDAREAVEALAPLETAEDASAASLSPDGQHLAIVFQGDLWMAPLDGGRLRRLTNDAGPGVFNGLPEFAAAEELDRYGGLWWSTDSRHLAFAHVDEGGVPPYMIGHLGAESAAWEEHRYPFAGGPNAIVTLKIVSPDSRRQPVIVDLGMAADDYLARVVPEAEGSWLVAVLPRAQRSLRWLRVTTDGKASELWTEASEPWLNLDDHTRALTDGRILRSTERSGFRHLDLRGANGAFERQLTAGDWMVTDVAHVDEARGEVLFLATADGATERHLYRVPLDSAEPIAHPERISAEPGWHLVSVSQDGSRWADTWSKLEQAPTVVLRRRDAPDAVVIHEPALTAETAGYLPPELLSVVAADGTTPLDAGLYRPARPAATPPPCVVWVYGGPRAQYVKRDWEMTVYPIRAYLALCGVAVVVVDNRGATARGLAFEAVLAGQLGKVEVADQVAALRQLADAGEIDPARVAIMGGSYGGFMTLMCIIREPSVFRAGVAIAPVTDQAGYDTAYTERYLGRPEGDPDAYERSSILPRAGELPDTALLIHGAIDENVHLRHSVRLVAALQALDRDIELVILPEDRHRARSADGLRTRDRRTVQHLLGALGVPLPDELGGPDGT